MYLRPTILVTITAPNGQHIEMRPGQVARFTQQESMAQLTQTAELTLPRWVALRGRPLREWLAVGQRVEVQLGDSWALSTSFVGYIAQIDPTTPILLKLEDDMWKLKQTQLSKAYPASTTLKELVADFWDGPSQLVDTKIGSFRVASASAAKVLEKLRTKYHLRVGFRLTPEGEPELHIGRLYTTRTVEVKFTRDVTSDTLQWASGEAVKYEVLAINELEDGTRETATVGTPGGAKTKLYFASTPDFKARAEAWLEQNKHAGYTGQLTYRGKERLRAGDIVQLENPRYPERSGAYFVEEVLLDYSLEGQPITITLGPPVD